MCFVTDNEDFQPSHGYSGWVLHSEKEGSQVLGNRWVPWEHKNYSHLTEEKWYATHMSVLWTTDLNNYDLYRKICWEPSQIHINMTGQEEFLINHPYHGAPKVVDTIPFAICGPVSWVTNA